MPVMALIGYTDFVAHIGRKALFATLPASAASRARTRSSFAASSSCVRSRSLSSRRSRCRDNSALSRSMAAAIWLNDRASEPTSSFPVTEQRAE